jgi:hypothetical protein
MKKLTALLMVMGILLIPAAGMAASPWTEKTTYSEKVIEKFSFGFKNLVLGVADIFYEPHRYQTEGKSAWAGLGKGLVDAPINVIGGALHLVTFLIPVDIPLPDNGVNFEK